MNSVLKLTIFFLAVFSSITTVSSQNTIEIAGAQYGAMSNSGSAHNGVWQNLINPAGIYNPNHFQVGAAYTNRFNLNELSSRSLVLSTPLKTGTLGITINSFGYSAFSQNHLSLAYALKLGDRLKGGIQLNYYSLNIAEGFGRFNAISGNLGFQYELNDKVSIGLLVKNPNRSQLSSEIQEYVQSTIQGGVQFQLAENLMILADLQKDIDSKPNFSMGLDYSVKEDWFLRGGLSTLNRGISFGFGYHFSKWSVDLASMHHQVLGFSSMISLTFLND